MKRQITIYESAKNGKITVFNDVECETLGDLKSLLRSKNIDYTGKEFVEGVTNTKLIADDSKIPTNIPFKGSTTNDVFINILNKDTKVKSGVNYSELSRGDLLRAAKPYAAEIESSLGVNYTRAKSADLVAFLNKRNAAPAKETEETPVVKPSKEEKGSSNVEKKLEMLVKAVRILAEMNECTEEVEEALEGWDNKEDDSPKEEGVPKSNFSDADIQNFIRK